MFCKCCNLWHCLRAVGSAPPSIEGMMLRCTWFQITRPSTESKCVWKEFCRPARRRFAGPLAFSQQARRLIKNHVRIVCTGSCGFVAFLGLVNSVCKRSKSPPFAHVGPLSAGRETSCCAARSANQVECNLTDCPSAPLSHCFLLCTIL